MDEIVRWRKPGLGDRLTERTIFCGWKIKKVEVEVDTRAIVTGDGNDEALNGSAVLEKSFQSGGLRVVVDYGSSMLGVVLLLSEDFERKDEESEEDAGDGHVGSELGAGTGR